MQMGEFPSTSILGSVNLVSQDRDGVRIDAPHGWEIHDVHHLWNKNETYHWETGNVFHMTSGQVLHLNGNTAEVHTTANVLTMHLDITPLQVHINQNPIGGIRFHWEPSIRTRNYHYHNGHFVNVNSSSATEAGEIELHASQNDDFRNAPQLSKYRMSVLNATVPTTGKMTLKADGEMKLHSKANIKIASGENSETKLSLTPAHNGARTEAKLSSEETFVSGEVKLSLTGGGSQIVVENNKTTINAGRTNCVFNGTSNSITTNANSSNFNGRINLGNPPTLTLDLRSSQSPAAASAGQQSERKSQDQ